MKLTNILLAHNDDAYRERLEIKLYQNKFKEVIISKKGCSALGFMMKNPPDIAILGSEFDTISVFEIIKTVSEKRPAIKFIIIFNDANPVNRIIIDALNIHGAVHYNDLFTELHKCLEHVSENKKYFSNTIYSTNDFKDICLQNLAILSSDELKILSLLAPYQQTEKIAKVLKMPQQKIQLQLEQISHKLQVAKGVTHLKEWATKNNDLILKMAVNAVA